MVELVNLYLEGKTGSLAFQRKLKHGQLADFMNIYLASRCLALQQTVYVEVGIMSGGGGEPLLDGLAGQPGISDQRKLG